MGTKYSSQATSGYDSSPPPDDGTQVAANLVTWSGVKTKLTNVLKTFAEAINTALVSALDLSARAIGSNDTAIASDHWKTLQVTGATTIQLSSAASMGAGYEVGVFNAGASTVTVTPAGSDTINLVSASVTVPIKGTMIFRTNQALTGYSVVGQSNVALNGLVSPSPSAGIGYSSGAGGSVTQLTNKSTGVTLNTICGRITMNGAALLGGAEVQFFLTNSTVDNRDTVSITHASGGTFGAYLIQGQCGSGSILISVRNQTGGSLSEAIILTFAIIRAFNA